MLTPERLLRLMIEFIFVLLGGLLIWLGLAGPAHGRTVDRHGAPWLALSVALILWDSGGSIVRANGGGAGKAGRAGFPSCFWAFLCLRFPACPSPGSGRCWLP